MPVQIYFFRGDKYPKTITNSQTDRIYLPQPSEKNYNSVKFVILIPCFNDWESLRLLFEKIGDVTDASLYKSFHFLIVDDCSTTPSPAFNNQEVPVHILQLNRNIGHQRAIAIGLSYVYNHLPCEQVIVMDADGEDKPEDISSLIHAPNANDSIVFARRTKRQEGAVFRFFYSIYKIIFRMLTGKRIEFGNFCIMPFHLLKNIVFVSEIWNHFSGGVIKSKVKYNSIPLDRGTRLAGASRMNFTSLIIHGMSAVSVHIDTVAVRLLLFSIGLIVMAVAGIIVVSCIRLFTPLAIPGWASYLVLAFAILLFQAFLISLFLVFVVLTYRTQKHFIPAVEYKNFIAEVKTF